MRVTWKFWKWKRLSMFKNDSTGAKYAMFCFRLNRHIQAGFKLQAKTLKLCLKTIDRIGIPTNEEEKDVIKKMVSLYDRVMAESNSQIARMKKYIED